MRRNLAPLASRILSVAAPLLLCSGLGCAALGDAAEGEDAADHGAAVDAGKHYTLWIHGRSPGTGHREGHYDDFSYWGPADAVAGINPRAVNWDGGGSIASTNGAVRRALDCFCTGDNWCYIVAHSAGNAQIGYAMSLHGASEREIKDATPGAAGECGSAGRGTQVGWNIKWVDVAGGAAGGTELANLGYWAVSDPLTSDLRTGTVRALYDHNSTTNVLFYMFPGAKGTLYSGALPGQDDEVIAYHSAGGLAGTGKFCNPGDWFCDDSLRLDTEGSRRGDTVVPKWNHHVTVFRDDDEAHDHYTRNTWGGIVSVAHEDAASYAY